MKMKGKVFLAMIAIMIFLIASTCIAKEVKAEELYTIADGMLGYEVTYTIKMSREYKLGEDMLIAFEFRIDESVSYFHFYGTISQVDPRRFGLSYIDFDKEYSDIRGGTVTETFELRLMEDEFTSIDETTIVIHFKFEYPGTVNRVAGWHRFEIDMRQFAYDTLVSDYETQMSTLQSQINELNNELNNLNNKNTELSSQLSDLQMTYDNLNRDYEGLERDHDSLKASHDSLQTDYNSLETDYEGIKSSYDSLTRDYSILESKYQMLSELGELGTTRSLMYIFVITTILFIATTVYFARRKPKTT